MANDISNYGEQNTSYLKAGELAGINKLVDDFYQNMASFKQAKKIRSMHPEDLTESRKKLSYFLSGWLGGPKLYQEHYGSINIPLAHQHLSVDQDAKDAWLLCMQKSVNQQNYEPNFKVYLMEQFEVPAQRIKLASN